jgi:hypothetical protein
MQFDFNLQPNQSQHIDVAGTFLKYIGGAGKIRVRLNGGGYIDLLPGQGIDNVKFNSIDVQDRTGVQNAGTVLAGMFNFRDDRITGTVDVVDGGKGRSLANASFFGFASCDTSVVGEYGHVQLWNPGTSGKNLYVSRIMLSSIAPTPNGAHVNMYNTPLANFQRYGTSKKNGGANSLAELRIATSPASLGTRLYALYLDQNRVVSVDMKEPIVLPPGTGMCVMQGVPQYGLPTTFDFWEEAV